LGLRGGSPAGVPGLKHPRGHFLRGGGPPPPHATANEVLVRIFRNVDRFEGARPQFRAWVFKIARNVLVDEHRRRAARPDTVPTRPDVLLDTATVDDELDRVDERERVEAMLHCLTDEQREVLLLRVVAGLSVDETARAMGRRPGAVRSLQHRALERLRTDLAAYA
jgi:RNA polymerase sigma factor (sigma-70 family)